MGPEPSSVRSKPCSVRPDPCGPLRAVFSAPSAPFCASGAPFGASGALVSVPSVRAESRVHFGAPRAPSAMFRAHRTLFSSAARPAPWAGHQAGAFGRTQSARALFNAHRALFCSTARAALWAVHPAAHPGRQCAQSVLFCCAPGALLERTSNPLCVCSRCSKSLFKIAVRESCLGITVLRFTSLCFTHTGMYMPGSH